MMMMMTTVTSFCCMHPPKLVPSLAWLVASLFVATRARLFPAAHLRVALLGGGADVMFKAGPPVEGIRTATLPLGSVHNQATPTEARGAGVVALALACISPIRYVSP